MKLVKCECCGSNQLQKHGGNAMVCSFCGSIYQMDENEKITSQELADAKIISLYLDAEKCRQAKRYGDEIQVLIKALELDEERAVSWVKLGRAYRVCNFHDKALECYRRAEIIEPQNAQTYTNMGAVYLVQQRYQEAAEYYEKGLSLISELDVDYPVVLANYAIVVAKNGNKKKAAKLMNEAERKGYANSAAARKMAGLGVLSKIFG